MKSVIWIKSDNFKKTIFQNHMNTKRICHGIMYHLQSLISIILIGFPYIFIINLLNGHSRNLIQKSLKVLGISLAHVC